VRAEEAAELHTETDLRLHRRSVHPSCSCRCRRRRLSRRVSSCHHSRSRTACTALQHFTCKISSNIAHAVLLCKISLNLFVVFAACLCVPGTNSTTISVKFVSIYRLQRSGVHHRLLTSVITAIYLSLFPVYELLLPGFSDLLHSREPLNVNSIVWRSQHAVLWKRKVGLKPFSGCWECKK